MILCKRCNAGLTAEQFFCSTCGTRAADKVPLVNSDSCDAPRFESQKAAFGIRLGAFLIDTIILVLAGPFICVRLIWVILKAQLPYPYNYSNLFHSHEEIFGTLYILLSLSYYMLIATPLQATLGKKILGLKVVSINGERVNFPQALGRSIASVLSMLPFGFGCLMVGWDTESRALHDKLTRTMVIRAHKSRQQEP